MDAGCNKGGNQRKCHMACNVPVLPSLPDYLFLPTYAASDLLINHVLELWNSSERIRTCLYCFLFGMLSASARFTTLFVSSLVLEL